jgi:hypothetical protein
MKSRKQRAKHVTHSRDEVNPAGHLGIVLDPKNRRERRARKSQEAKAQRAFDKGETPKIFIDMG